MYTHTQPTKGEERTPEDGLAWFGLEAFTANLIPAPSLLEASYILNLFTYLLSQPIKCSFEILQLLLLQAVFSKIKYTVLFPPTTFSKCVCVPNRNITAPSLLYKYQMHCLARPRTFLAHHLPCTILKNISLKNAFSSLIP